MEYTSDINPLSLRPTCLNIDLDALARNCEQIMRRVAPAKVMAIVKSNAYGHGLVPCARVMEERGIFGFGVAFLEEAIQLRQGGITAPILVLGGIVGRQLRYFIEYGVDITASSIDKLEAIEEVAASMGKKARIHLKIDTGMERIGVHYYSCQRFLERAIASKSCEIVGIFSHFATVKEADCSFAYTQLERFLEVVSFFEKRSLPTPMRHIASTGAILKIPESALDLVRPGIGLYGVYPGADLQSCYINGGALEPVMSLKSQVVYFKVVKKGAGVSYGHTWVAPEQTRVVTIPIGYGDGYMRRLSNEGCVLIGGKRRPVVGTVCMDQLMVNLGCDGTAYNGDEVVLIGEQDGERITVNEIAEIVNTTPHEVMVALNLRLPRKYTYQGRSHFE